MKFKEGVKLKDIEDMHPAAIYLMAQVNLYAYINKFDLTITSLISDHAPGPPHSDGRAWDMRIYDIPVIHKIRIVRKLNENFKEIGAIGKESGESIVAIEEEDHIHIQVREDSDLRKIMKII